MSTSYEATAGQDKHAEVRALDNLLSAHEAVGASSGLATIATSYEQIRAIVAWGHRHQLVGPMVPDHRCARPRVSEAGGGDVGELLGRALGGEG